MELKAHPDSKTFHRALSSLYAAAKRSKDRTRTTYPLSNYQNGAARSHCSTLLSRHGILPYLTKTVKNGRIKYTIKAVINPRKVLDLDSDYLGVAPTDEESLELFSNEFTLLMRKYHLPEFLDEWTLTRLELRCYPPYLKRLINGKRQHTVSEQFHWLTLHSRELIPKKAAHAFSSGTHYKPSTAEALIKGSPYHKNTRRQLWWLFKRMRYPFDLEQLEKGMKKQFGLSPRTTSKRLEQLQVLGINLIPLQKDFYMEQLPSLPLVLKLLEDNTTTVKLVSDGTVEYWRCIF